MNKKKLAIMLSKISQFEAQDVKLEQYPTDPEIAADALWHAYQQGDIEDKIVADLGCGPGVLGIGALLLGAKKVHFVDIDKKAMKVAKKNLAFVEKETDMTFNVQFYDNHVADFKTKVDVVIQNPPFGVKNTHADKLFLMHAMEIAKVIYSFHKLSTRRFIESFVKDSGYEIKSVKKYNFPLKKKMWFHTRNVKFIDVGMWKIEKFKKK